MLTHSLHTLTNHDGATRGKTHCKLSGTIYYWDFSLACGGRGELRTDDGVMIAVEHAFVDKKYEVGGAVVKVYCDLNPNVTCRECIKRIAI